MPPPTDPRWPERLSQASHELRTPLTVAGGWLRMVMSGRAGTVSEVQQRLLQDVQKSLGRMLAILDEVSDLAKLESGDTILQRQSADLNAILKTAVDELPPLPDRTVYVDVQADAAAAPIQAHPGRLGAALGSIVNALRRELVTSDRLQVQVGRQGGNYQILIGDAETLDILRTARDGDLPPFQEKRGGTGMSLAIAQWVINAHEGRVRSAPEDRKAGAKITLPAAA